MGLLVAALLAAPAAPIPADRAEAVKVVGVWKLVRSTKGSEQRVSLEVEFTAGGRMVIRQSNLGGGPVAVYEGKYRVEDGTIPYTVSAGGAPRGETLTIKKLTATELVVDDPDGIREEFERAKDRK